MSAALIYQKKFRYAGNKSGGLRGWEMLQSAGLGELRERKAARGTDKFYEFWKKEISDDAHEKEDMMKKLLQFKVSLTQYRKAFEMENVTIETITSRKRKGSPSRSSSRLAAHLKRTSGVQDGTSTCKQLWFGDE